MTAARIDHTCTQDRVQAKDTPTNQRSKTTAREPVLPQYTTQGKPDEYYNLVVYSSEVEMHTNLREVWRERTRLKDIGVDHLSERTTEEDVVAQRHILSGR